MFFTAVTDVVNTVTNVVNAVANVVKANNEVVQLNQWDIKSHKEKIMYILKHELLRKPSDFVKQSKHASEQTNMNADMQAIKGLTINGRAKRREQPIKQVMDMVLVLSCTI